MRIVLSALIIAFAFLIGHFEPLYYLFVGTFLLPLGLLYINLIRAKQKSINIGAITTLWAVLLINLFFRLYGGGRYDQVARTLADASLAISLIISFMFIVFYKIKQFNQKIIDERNLLLLIVELIAYLISPILFFLIFMNF